MVYAILIQNIYLCLRNADVSDIAVLQASSIEIDDEDPLPENIANVEIMHCVGEAVRNWIDPVICPHIVKNCRNSKRQFQSMSWKI